MTSTKIRKELEKRMKKKGIKAAELTRLANVNPATLYNFLNEKSGITTTVLDRLAIVLNRR